MFLCVCKGVRVSEAVDAARSGANTPESLIEAFGFEDDECCGRCAREIDSIVLLVSDEIRESIAIARTKSGAGVNGGKIAALS